jgi:hypothetical protein
MKESGVGFETGLGGGGGTKGAGGGGKCWNVLNIEGNGPKDGANGGGGGGIKLNDGICGEFPCL